MIQLPEPNPAWAHRGRICRDRRVVVGPYCTMRQLAQRIGIPTVDVSKMENGRANPSFLENWWAHQDDPAAGIRRLVNDALAEKPADPA